MSLIVDMLTVAAAWASAAEAEHHAPSINQILFPLGNFLIFVWILKRFALPLARDFLRSRREEILTTVQTAAENKRRAEAIIQDYRSRLAGVDQEARSIEASLRAEGERQKAKLLEEAQALTKKMIEDARFLADQEVKIARQKIREEVANLAEARARELVQRHITAGDQARLAEEFLREMGRN
jgi:F-type H+-transporting ATPase subunit b